MVRELVIGVDIGATKTRICLGDFDGNIYEKYVYLTSQASPNIVKFIISEVEKNFSHSMKDVVGIGVASIGPLDLRRGTILSPPNAPFRNVEVVTNLEGAFGIKTFLINDAVAAVWAEKVYGLGRIYRNLAYITLSTGIGAGVIVDDNLLIGKDGNAHEVGHIVIDSSGEMRCRCGGYGHWEAYCSGINIPIFVEKLLREKYASESRGSSLFNEHCKGGLTTEVIFKHAKLGDKLALKIIEDEVGKLNAAGVASVVNCYDPEIVLLGGAITLNNKELVINPIVRHIDRYLTNRKPIITSTDLGEDVVLKGAIALVAQPPQTLIEYYRRS
ncbi:MAG: ROK family protein [Candidatus Nezhaarchaeales archaeon]|nr:MAG: ROK family protein [Candidatus Nezhaarchaeota archaeon WYZ-LMO8]TDA36008.1 MAG: ROK family protein [Candidatus Nezhaarchaeota archaeon WYZ-LMO7]